MERALGKTAIARHDPLLSELRDQASSESGGEELLVGDPVGSWADHMECADGLVGFELASRSPGKPFTMRTITCWISAWICMVYRRMNRSHCRWVSTPPLRRQLTKSTHPSSHCTTVQLRNWKWTGPLLHQLRSSRSSLGFSFLPNRRLTGTTCPCSLILSQTVPRHGTNHCLPAPRCLPMDSFLDMDGAEKAGLVNPLPMEASLAAYLAPA